MTDLVAVAGLLGPTLLAGLYLAGTARYQRLRRRRWPVVRTVAFLAGTALLCLALSPVGEGVAGGEARDHMARHVAIGMWAPIGLVLGAPVALLLGTSPLPWRRPMARVLRSPALRVATDPFLAGVLNVGSMYLLYLTPLYALSSQGGAVHHLVHVHFLLAGCLFTWAIVGPEPTPHRPRVAVRVVALVLAAAAHAHLGKLLYARAETLPPGTGYGVAEVQAAAQWMYYGGDLAEVLLATVLFATWYRQAGHRMRRTGRPTGRARPAPVRSRPSPSGSSGSPPAPSPA